MKRMFFLTLILGVMVAPYNLFAGFLTDEDIHQAKTLGKASISFEEVTQASTEKAQPTKPNWLTLDKFEFSYKNQPKNFYVANSFNSSIAD